MKYFEVILEHGHIGAGNGFEVKRYFKGRDMISVISKTRCLPRIKKRNTIEAVKFVRIISKEEYLKGRIGELKIPFLFRVKNGYRCPICGRLFKDIFSFEQHVYKYEASLKLAS